MILWSRYKDTIAANWHLGFTAFGGAPVQFQIVSFSWEILTKTSMGSTDGETASQEVCRGA